MEKVIKKLFILLLSFCHAAVGMYQVADDIAQGPSSQETVLSGSKRSGPDLSSFDDKRARPDLSSIKLLYTPKDNTIGLIAQDIDEVKENGYIGVESPSLTNRIIIDKLLEASRRGVNVKVFVKKEAHEQHVLSVYADLRDNNITVVEIADLHAKRLVFAKNIPAKDGDRVVYLGSLNMTQNSPDNYEVMIRSTDTALFRESYGDQQRLGKSFYKSLAAKPIDFSDSCIINSFYPEAKEAKKRVITEFASSTHPHDFLYIAAYTFDDIELAEELIKARQRCHWPIKIIIDHKDWQKNKIKILKPLVMSGIEVYIFNKDKVKKTSCGHPLSMHMKAIIRQYNQEGLSFLSTGNFTHTGTREINHDLWEPCSIEFAKQFRSILDLIIEESSKLTPADFYGFADDGTPEEMGCKLLSLMQTRQSISTNIEEILRLIRSGADVNQKNHYFTALIAAVSSGQLEIVQALIDADIKPTLNYSNKDGSTPIFIAVQNGYSDIAAALLKECPDISINGDYQADGPFGNAGSTPILVQAVLSDNIEIIQMLVEKDVRIYEKDRHKKNAFDHAVQKPKILNFLNDVKYMRENPEEFMLD